MEKLIYKKIGNDSIAIDLHNDYTVIAMELYNYETKKYEVTFYLKENSVDLHDLIEEQEKIEFDVDYKIINSAILKHVANLLSEGFYEKYISRYDYMLKCFDKGNELLESERTANAS
jgi:hypothetical protein